MLRTFEVLAPAKNLEYGIQAVKCGADAVYIACDKFGLRNRCSNSVEDIKKLIEFAHRYWVRVYVTLNSTIYTEKDFKYIRETIIDLYEELIQSKDAEIALLKEKLKENENND